MAFGLYLGCPNDLCDKCNKITCLSKAIEKAKKAAEVSA